MERSGTLLKQDENKKRFRELLLATQRPGVENLLEWLENRTDFYESPASSVFHGAYTGGLLDHSLNVYDHFMKLVFGTYPEYKIYGDSIAIVCLLHDLCKVNTYKVEQRNRKNSAGQWESYDYYARDEQFPFGGHGSKSVYLAQKFIDLSYEEAAAINCHMGCWDGNKEVSKAYEEFPIAWLLHVADEAATYITEGVK